MKTRNLIFTALTALALTALAGCSTETELPQEAPDTILPEGMARIEFAIKGVKTGISYAGSVQLEPAEAKINDVTAYLFKLADGETAPAATAPLSAVVNATIKESGAVGNFIMPTNAADTRYGIVFVVNKGCFNAALGSVAIGTTTYAALNDIETLDNKTIMANLATTGLPMRHLKADVVIPADGGTVNIGDLFFARPLSRFDVDNQALHSFTISSVVLRSAHSTSPLNAPATVGEVATDALADIEYTPFISDVNEKLADANPDGTKSKLRPAFYAAPGLEADGSSLLVKGKLRVGLDLVDREYIVPLINKADGAKVILSANKRYRVTLKMDKGSDIIGEVAVNLGSWDEEGGDPDFSQDMNYMVMPTSINIEAIYTKSVRTFEVPYGTTAFEFTMLNDLNVTPTKSGVVTKVEAGPATLGVNAFKYTVTVNGTAPGKGTFVFEKDGTTYTFTVVVLPRVTYNVNGTEVDATFTGGIVNEWTSCPGVYWAPVNLGATTAEEPGSLYQYGRMKGWPDGATAVAAGSNTQIPIAESETGGNDAKFITSSGSWWTDTDQTVIEALIARWSGLSDGTNSPCPAGWRLPTNGDFIYLRNRQQPVFAEVGAGVHKVTLVGVTLVRKEKVSSGSVTTGTSGYWLPDDMIYFSPDIFSNWMMSAKYYSANGNYIRCVKDKAPLN